jgi:hypothetical protein
MNTEIESVQAQQAALLAYQQLIRLNLELHKSEVENWLHSEAAEPALKRMLENVPCFGHVH